MESLADCKIRVHSPPKISLTSDTFRLDNFLGLIELTESCYPHSYSLLEGKDTDENQPTDKAHWAESREIPNMELSLFSSHGVRTHYFLGITV